MALSELRRDPENSEISFLKRYFPQSDEHILDIGCGDGRLTRLFSHSAGFAVGTDIDMEELRNAKSTHPKNVSSNVGFASTVGEAMPFLNVVFNLAIFSWSL